MPREMIPVAEAKRRVIELAREERFMMLVEEVDVLDAIGRIVARDITSDIDVAPFDNTAMDGFAVQSQSLENASPDAPVNLEIVEWIGAGGVPEKTLEAGQAIRIMTGALMPAGADAVVKIEDTTYTGEGGVGDTVTMTSPIASGRNIRYAGEEVKAGAVALHKGEKINPSTAGLLAATGNLTVPVYARPKVGILSIGTELLPPTEKPKPGMIRDSNTLMLASYAKAAGAIPHVYPIVVDEEEAIEQAFATAVKENDMVVSSGGACDGDFDFAIGTLKKLGTALFDLVSIRPAKAQAFGCIGDTLVQVNSGNPVGAAVGFEMFARPALLAMQGATALDRPITKATLAKDTRKKEARAFYQRGHLEPDGKGGYLAVQEKSQSSALIGELHRATVLIILPEGTGTIPAGTEVECMHLDVDEGVLI